MKQQDRLARREALRVEIGKLEAQLAALRAEVETVLEGCEHQYADGRPAGTGGRVKVCAICGHVLKSRDEKLWG